MKALKLTFIIGFLGLFWSIHAMDFKAINSSLSFESEKAAFIPIESAKGYGLLVGDLSEYEEKLPHDAFTGEPLTTDKLQKGEFDAENLKRHFGSHKKSLKCGLSVLLCQNNDKELTIVGERLAEDLADFFERIDLTAPHVEYLISPTIEALNVYCDVFNIPLSYIDLIRCNPGETESFKNHIREKRVAHFGGLAILPDHRGKGLSHILVQKAIELAKRENYNTIVVETTGNGSYKIMQKAGFEILKELVYDKPLNGHTAFRICRLILEEQDSE